MKCGYWNAWEAAFCNLCYEPFNRKSGAKAAPECGPGPEVAAPAGLASPTPPPRPWPWPLKIAFLLLGLALVASLFPVLPPMHPGLPGSFVNRYSDKTDAADRLLTDLAGEKERLLTEVAAESDPEGFGLDGKYTARLVKLEEDYAAAINALGLPCPTCVDEKKDAAYLDWTREHTRRESEAAASFSGRYQQQIQKALGRK